MGTRRFQISEALLLNFFEQGSEHCYRVIKDGFPKDTRILRVAYMPNWPKLELTLCSPEWNETEGDVIPVMRRGECRLVY